ncbi:MAG: DNA-directed RNA polymerase subunit omega [Candidatus Aceula meridiana]|nr:DNA-directed RNA polymerase subunit omega [Candidatus Aceula meridiana]
MAYQPLEKLLPKAANSIYRLVLLAAKRATELAEGMPSLVERPSNVKTTTLALDEILEGKVVLKGCESQGNPGKPEEAKAEEDEEDEDKDE